ncbi:RNA polymerase sigma-54 factor [Polystyrenella longa]|uniref:RNA polymerase sigma-54 factor n=1 Tax=Polystyrenella longa TaxID=2528007 RepID=A0A518CHY5_9PLAN|nr:RNA polymerase factor sigma-54 [Polystyrenella longa]QDU78827.1 RNA polymerase sigma-54 factor [Polystyrenella longa]
MHLSHSQQMKMDQQMKLAPRMIQSMEILQLPLMALQERIEQELEENVVLEQLQDDPENRSETEVEVEREKAQDSEHDTELLSERELLVDNDHNNEADFERLMEMSQEWSEDNSPSGSRVSSNRMDDISDRQHDAIANLTEQADTLQEYLLEQFSFFECDDELREFGEYLIQNLDKNGRLQSSLAEISQVYGRIIDIERAEEALQLIQKLDPPGVGARNVKECLLLQLTDETPFRDVLVTLITEHFEDMGKNRLPVITRKTGYSIELIKAAEEELRKLNPFPGRGYEEVSVQRVTADLKVEQDDDGKWTVELIDEYIPELRISPRYIRMMQNNPDAETKAFIKKKVESATWLIESIEQRYGTIKAVAQAIIDHQSDFLENGPQSIVPLKMQQIADVVGRHVTTVSRAVDDKWIQTPRGLYPLKRFFGGGTTTADGEEVAWENIRRKLKEVIDGEDKQSPLSDDALVDALAKEGLTLARRTVTKYRKKMGIPSSRERREY